MTGTVDYIVAIAVQNDNVYRFEQTVDCGLVYKNGVCVGQLDMKSRDQQLLFEIFENQTILRCDAVEFYGAKKRKATISEALNRINASLRTVFGYTSQEDIIKTLKKSTSNPESLIAHQFNELRDISYFVSGKKSSAAVWKSAVENLKSFSQPEIVKEAMFIQHILHNIPSKNTVDSSSDNPLKVLLLCEPQVEKTVIVQLMKTLSNFSTITLEVNSQPQLDETDYLGFIALITPGMSAFHKRTVERLLNHSSKHGLPFFAFKERSIEKFNLIAKWIEYSQDDFLLSVSDISDVFHRLYSEVLSKNLLHLAKSNPDEYIQKYADLYDVRLLTNIDAKKRVANAVVEDIIYEKGYQSVFLDSGTVTYYIAERLYYDGHGITIYTNNLSIARLRGMCTKVHLLPGSLSGKVEATVGYEPAAYLRKLCNEGKIDVGVLGMRSYDNQLGFGEDTPLLRGLQKALLEVIPKLVVVSQGEKLFKPVENPLYDDPEEGIRTIQKRKSEKSLELYIHEPTLDQAALRLNTLKMYIKRYERMLKHLQSNLGNDAVHVLSALPDFKHDIAKG